MLIGKRVLKLNLEDGATLIPVHVYAPEDNNPGWSCRYVIEWPHGHWESAGWGVDAIQALNLTLQKIGIEIYASSYHQSGRLQWTEAEKGYGFPVPKNARAMLIGDDLDFDG